MKKIITLLLLGCVTTLTYAQEAVSTDTLAKKEKKYTLIPMPIIAANPTMGFMFGLAPGVSFRLGDEATTRMSNFLGTIIYTTNKQFYLTLRGSMFLKDDSWLLSTDARFVINSQPTYGLGTRGSIADETITGPNNYLVSDKLFSGPGVNEMMAFNHIRFYQTALKRYADTRFFYGIGYNLDVISKIDDKELDLTSDPMLITNHYKYQTDNGLPTTAYTQSGITLNLTFDSRDNIANPYSGRMANVSLRMFPEFLGSTAGSSLLWLEYRDYIHLNKNRQRNLIGIWNFEWLTLGGSPSYLFLPATGWDMMSRSARPYTQGRFRGENLSYTETEWRFPLQKDKETWGGVLFTNFTSASNKAANINLFSTWQLGYGGGLRYMIDKKNKINIALDYGWGHNGATGMFLNLNEMF
jgi:hypothetical protein